MITIILFWLTFVNPSPEYCDNLYHTNEVKFNLICNQEETTERIMKAKR